MLDRIVRGHAVSDYASSDLATAHGAKNLSVSSSTSSSNQYGLAMNSAATPWTTLHSQKPFCLRPAAGRCRRRSSSGLLRAGGRARSWLRRCQHHWVRRLPHCRDPIQHWGIQSEADIGHFEGVQHLHCGGARSSRGLHLSVELLEILSADCVQQCVLIREMYIDRRRGHSGPLSDRTNRNCFRVPGLDQKLGCGVNDRVAQLGAGSTWRAVAANSGNCLRRVVATLRPSSCLLHQIKCWRSSASSVAHFLYFREQRKPNSVGSRLASLQSLRRHKARLVLRSSAIATRSLRY